VASFSKRLTWSNPANEPFLVRAPALTQADRPSDKHGMSRRSALLILLVTAAPPVYGRRLLRCGGAFEKSCVRRLYHCFDATGSCTRDITQFFSQGVVTDCWQNGARITLSGFQGTGTAALRNSRGKTCLTGTTVGHPDASIEITYRRHKRHYLIARTPNGAFTVTCPNGKVENYSPADVKAAGCGPIADCSFGACP